MSDDGVNCFQRQGSPHIEIITKCHLVIMGEKVIWDLQLEIINSKTITDDGFVAHVTLPQLEKQHGKGD